MNADLIHSFVVAARDILAAEARSPVHTGAVTCLDSPLVSHEVSVLIGLAHSEGGVVVLCGMSETTARRLVSAMMGEPVEALDAVAQSAVGEIANMIAGRAAVELAKRGCEVNITPPRVVLGKRTISACTARRLVFPIFTAAGGILIHIAPAEVLLVGPSLHGDAPGFAVAAHRVEHGVRHHGGR